MKKYNYIVMGLLFAGLTMTACQKNDNPENEKEKQRREEALRNEKIQETLKKEAPQLKSYVEANAELKDAKLDTKTGIWYKIIQEGDNNSYTYKLNAANAVILPEMTVNYKAQLLDGKLIKETNKPIAITRPANIFYFTGAWSHMLFPKQLQKEGKTISLSGITMNGLKKGAKVRFVSPSPWAFSPAIFQQIDNKITIPTNSPIDFTIEVVDIKDSSK